MNLTSFFNCSPKSKHERGIHSRLKQKEQNLRRGIMGQSNEGFWYIAAAAPMTVKASHAIKYETSKFERAMNGLRIKELIVKTSNEIYGKRQSSVEICGNNVEHGSEVPKEMPTQKTDTKNRELARVSQNFTKHRSHQEKARLAYKRDVYRESGHRNVDDSNTIVSLKTENSKIMRHQDVTRQLLRQAIEGSDFALLNVIIRLTPFVKDYLQDKDKNGNTLLHQCCKDGNCRLVAVLIETGVEINTAGKNGRTPLHLAALLNDMSIVLLLLNSCADVNAKDREGSRPVDLCSDSNVRAVLLRRMSWRSRSFNSRRLWQCNTKSVHELQLSRTDSGILIDRLSAADEIPIIRRNDSMCYRILSSYRDFRFSKETIV